MLFAGLLFVASPADAADWPVGAAIDPALVVDITPEGFDSVALMIPSLLPPLIEIPDTSSELVDIWVCTQDFAISNGWVGVQVLDANITPGNGVLDIRISLLVNVNNANDEMNVTFDGCVDMTCPTYVDPFPVDIHTTMALSIVDGPDGTKVLDATMGAVEVSYALANEDIHLDCFVGDLEEILGYIGLSIYDLIIDQFAGTIDDLVADLGPTLETTIEEAFSSASIVQDIDLGGVAAHLELNPTSIQVQPSGLRLVMGGLMSGEAATCIAEFDPNGSLQTLTDAPEIGSAPSDIRTPYHLGIGITDDFVNQVLYVVWRGGLLCYTLEEGGAFPLDTSILNLLSGDAFVALFPESRPVTMRTRPRAAPTANYTGPNDVDINLNELDLEFYAELDGRLARIVDVQINGTAGANLALDGTTGSLDIALALDPANLIPTVVYNEFYPASNATIEASFGSTFGSLLDSVIGGLLPELAFVLPAISGVGLQDLETSATGEQLDWLGAYAWIGGVTYGSADGCGGCGEDGSSGCGDTSSCSSGCSTSTGVPKAVFLAPLFLAVLLRRRP